MAHLLLKNSIKELPDKAIVVINLFSHIDLSKRLKLGYCDGKQNILHLIWTSEIRLNFLIERLLQKLQRFKLCLGEFYLVVELNKGWSATDKGLPHLVYI